MNLFRNIFGNEKELQDTPSFWNTLNSEAQLEDLISRSHSTPVAIFKHSTRCSISSVAQTRLERLWDIPVENVELYHLDLITYRSVSNRIAEALEVPHESPQILLIKEGKAIYHTSHNDISVQGIKEHL